MSRVKMEEQSFLLDSPSPDLMFGRCFDFYDEQSNNFIIKSECTVKQIMSFLQSNVDICDTPLKQILKIVEENYERNADLNLIKKMIVKQKHVLKRNRAKNRKESVKEKKDVSLVAVAICDKGQEEESKKKNRMSAQISRDKKKKRVKELQQMNKRLQEECNLRKLENQRLKETIESNKVKSENGSTNQSGSKLRRMLVFLGIIFLCSLIKDIFTNENTIKLSTPLLIPPTQKTEISYFDHTDPTQEEKIMSVISSPLTELLQDESLSQKLKNHIIAQIHSTSQVSTLLPLRLKSQIQDIKSQNLL